MGILKLANGVIVKDLYIPDRCPYCNTWHDDILGGGKKIPWRFIKQTKSSNQQVQKSYSVGKGLLGAALFGPVGALAGINGKTTTYGSDRYLVTAICEECKREHSFETDKNVYSMKEYQAPTGDTNNPSH